MRHATETRMSYIWYDADRYEQWNRVTQSVLVNLGLVLAPKTCPDRSPGYKEVNNRQAFTVGKKQCALICLNKPLPGDPRNVQRSTQIVEEPTA